MRDPRDLLRSLLDAALGAVAPERCLPQHLPPPPRSGRTLVLGAGKASAAMARAVEGNWPGLLTGVVVTPYGHGLPCERVEVIEASHPLPDEAGTRAAQRLLALARQAGAYNLVLGLFSGGGSSLLALPAPGISLEDQRRVGRALLRSGAGIHETNVVRRHLSAIKGGRLALACFPAQVVTLLISDVPGDDPALIASGPTVADSTTRLDALAVLEHYGVEAPRTVNRHLRGDSADDPLPEDLRLALNEVVTVATAREALNAAADAARRAGVTPHILGAALEGEARVLGEEHAELALRTLRGGGPAVPPCVLLSGGETSVTARGDGRGGRNTEYLLSLAMGLKGSPGIWALAADTDGIDGSEDNAGAMCPPELLARASETGMEAGAFLERNDSYGFFSALGELVVTGPTLTNVSDFRAILVTSED